MRAKKRRVGTGDEYKRCEDVKVIGFQVRSATGAAGTGSTNHLLQYSSSSCWQSYVRPKEALVLALYVALGMHTPLSVDMTDGASLLLNRETKTLLSEVRILNKVRSTVI
jgi:hypothetical protein